MVPGVSYLPGEWHLASRRSTETLSCGEPYAAGHAKAGAEEAARIFVLLVSTDFIYAGEQRHVVTKGVIRGQVRVAPGNGRRPSRLTSSKFCRLP